MSNPRPPVELAPRDNLTYETPDHGRFKFVNTATREEWKAARRCFITATDASRLASLTNSAWDAVRDEKTGASAGFSGNAATQWGHDREPAIMDYIATVDATVTPNSRLVVCKDDPRFAATPDGVSVDGMVTGQAKTSNHSADPSAPARAWVDQVQWEMLCAGATECILAVEEHDGNGTIIGTRHAIIPADRDRQAALVAIVERFLAGEQAVPPTGNEALTAAIDRWADLKQQAADLNKELKAAETEVRNLIGKDAGEWSTPRWAIKQTAPTTSHRIDADALRADWPEIAEKVTKVTTTKGRLSAPVPVTDDTNEGNESK